MLQSEKTNFRKLSGIDEVIESTKKCKLFEFLLCLSHIGDIIMFNSMPI